ncbi:hypothetical protein UCREL1_7486 [Eutypa lata UCREL1]|uniref:Uncharacterized protein n=1 Tax=Eutypa lata (strain UCR-EL1) TaxID=1287681 RepID=M7SMV6_EUTLA|nr:hypothetical protein UCREL1_7486 [Eutypa lata UCREL1]
MYEWMHVKKFGYREYIDDVTDSDNGFKVYGDRDSHKFAWKYMGRVTPSVNPAVARNAENYAWYFAYKWFHNHWNWEESGVFKRKIPVEEEEVEEDPGPSEFDVTSDEIWAEIEKNGDIGIPINMEEIGTDEDGLPVYDIGYIGDDYDYFVDVSSKESYRAPNSDCILSAECHFSYSGTVNPACTCECDGEQVSLRDDRCAGFGGIEGDMVDVGPSSDAR